MTNIKIIGILIKDRIKEAGKTQKALTDFAHIIETRMGFHEVSEIKCSRVGVIILHLTGNQNEWNQFEEALSQIGGIEVKTMQFEY
jgi:hypothetical protein